MLIYISDLQEESRELATRVQCPCDVLLIFITTKARFQKHAVEFAIDEHTTPSDRTATPLRNTWEMPFGGSAGVS
jgi:hypothetical protein